MDRASHLTKASDCERVAATLNTTDAAARCWSVIMKFYAALHYVDAYFAEQRYEFIDHHEDRRRRLGQFRETRRIEDAYRRLERLSWAARYDSITVTEEDARRANGYFTTVRQAMRTALKLAD